MTGFPLFWLAILTLVLVLGFACWNYISTRRKQKHGADTHGMGGDSDPLG